MTFFDLFTQCGKRNLFLKIGKMLLVPILKRGNFTNCDNWRGIALLDMVGKVAASIIRTTITQNLAEKVLPKS